MYRITTCQIEGDKTAVVYKHPVFNNYGLALKVERRQDAPLVECNIVVGSIDGSSKLETVTDHSAPLEVQVWCFTCMLVLRESVNMKSLSLDTLFSNNSGVVYYK